MKSVFRYTHYIFIIFALAFITKRVYADKLLAQDISVLTEACKNNFENVKGTLIGSDNTRDIYSCLHQIDGYNATYLAVDKATNSAYVYAYTNPITDFWAEFNCNRITRVLKTIAACEVDDTKNTSDNIEERSIKGKIPYTTGYILVNGTLRLNKNPEILLCIQKPVNKI